MSMSPSSTSEVDELLMEALMDFGSNINNSEVSSSSSDIETKGVLLNEGETTIDKLDNDEQRLDLAVADVLSHFPVCHLTTLQTPSASQAKSTKPSRRRRVKKCTYAARRLEAARLRTLSAQLNAHLNRMLRKQQRGRDMQNEAHRQQSLLLQAQEENERLHAMVRANERRIREAQATVGARFHFEC